MTKKIMCLILTLCLANIFIPAQAKSTTLVTDKILNEVLRSHGIMATEVKTSYRTSQSNAKVMTVAELNRTLSIIKKDAAQLSGRNIKVSNTIKVNEVPGEEPCCGAVKIKHTSVISQLLSTEEGVTGKYKRWSNGDKEWFDSDNPYVILKPTNPPPGIDFSIDKVKKMSDSWDKEWVYLDAEITIGSYLTVAIPGTPIEKSFKLYDFGMTYQNQHGTDNIKWP